MKPWPIFLSCWGRRRWSWAPRLGSTFRMLTRAVRRSYSRSLPRRLDHHEGRVRCPSMHQRGFGIGSPCGVNSLAWFFSGAPISRCRPTDASSDRRPRPGMPCAAPEGILTRAGIDPALVNKLSLKTGRALSLFEAGYDLNYIARSSSWLTQGTVILALCNAIVCRQGQQVKRESSKLDWPFRSPSRAKRCLYSLRFSDSRTARGNLGPPSPARPCRCRVDASSWERMRRTVRPPTIGQLGACPDPRRGAEDLGVSQGHRRARGGPGE